MKIISHKDIMDLAVSPRTCYEWVEYMLAHKNEALLPAKISIKDKDGIFCNVMPCILPMPDRRKVGGTKIVTRYPQRNPALDSKIILFDADSGECKAILDGNWITAMRTGAVTAHSVLLLAVKGFTEVSMMGLGNAARAALLVLASMLPERKLHIKLLRYKGQEQLFAERFCEFDNLRFSYVDTAESLVRESQVVISAATYLPQNVCEDSCFEKGVLLAPIHTLGFTNCDLFFDKVFADDRSHVCGFKYFDKFRSFAEVSDVLCGKAKGRENNDERIIAYNIGIAMHDLFFAANLFALSGRKGQTVDFCEPTDKFWI